MGVTTNKVDDRTVTAVNRGEVKDEGLAIQDFFENVVLEYNQGSNEKLDADIQLARSVVPAGTGVLRDFSYIAP